MLHFRDLPLRTKGLIVIAIPICSLIAVVVAFSVAHSRREQVNRWVEQSTAGRNLIQSIRGRWEMAETATLGYVTTHSPQWLQVAEESAEGVPALFGELEAISPESTPRREQVAAARKDIFARLDELQQIRARAGTVPVAELLRGSLARQQKVRADLLSLRDAEARLLAQRTAEEAQAGKTTDAVIIAGAVLAFVGGTLAMLLFTNTIGRRVQVLDRNAQRLARGEALAPLERGKDEIGRLGESLGAAATLLADRQRRLEQAAVDLEARVRERTAELERANEALAGESAGHARAEEELADAKRRLEAVIDASPLAIAAADMDGNLIGWNRAAEEMFGWESEEVIGKPLPTVPDEERADFEALRARAMAGEALSAQDVRRKKRDGTPVDVRFWTAPLRGPEGEVRGTIAVMADVTNQRRLEQQFAQSQKMEAIGRLAGGVAHDFNNVITVISGYGQMLLEGVRKDPVLHEAAQEVLNSADRAAALAGQLLSFSRRSVIQPRVLDINALVSNMERLLGRVIGEDIELKTFLHPGVGPIRADPGQIEQVIMNLAVNARDAMPSGGKLLIETANVQLDTAYAGTHAGVRPGPYVMVAVTDTGVGMDAETKAHLFEPFFTTKERGKGTGLGLSTVYGIVKQHGGDIWVYSEPGKGSTFKIYLPRVIAPVVTEEGPREEPVRRGTETILLVEDEAGVRKLVRDVLEQRGYHVLEAGSGDEALAVAAKHDRIDMLLTDVVMPRMGGRELAHELTRLRPGLPVLFLSGYTDEVIADQKILGTGADFLQKPFAPDVLARKIREILDRPAGNKA